MKIFILLAESPLKVRKVAVYHFLILFLVLELLRQDLFDIRVGNSNLAKNLSEKVTMQCTKMKTPTEASYPCKVNKGNHFSPILVTSIHKTDSF